VRRRLAGGVAEASWLGVEEKRINGAFGAGRIAGVV